MAALKQEVAIPDFERVIPRYNESQRIYILRPKEERIEGARFRIQCEMHRRKDCTNLIADVYLKMVYDTGEEWAVYFGETNSPLLFVNGDICLTGMPIRGA